MLFNYILFFVWLHAFISPVSDGKMPLKLICDAQPPVPDGQADEMSASNMVFLSLLFSSAPGPTPIPRLPAYSPLAVPVYPGMGKRAKSTRFNLEKRMGRVRAWFNLLSIRFGQVVKSSHPGPTRVVHTPTRVLQPEPTASPTTAHQRPSGVLIDFSALLGAYWLAVAWTLVTFGFTGVILARLVRVAHSEARELEELIDLYAEIDHDSPDGVFSCFSRPLSPASEALGFTSTGSEHLVIHSSSPSFLPSNPVPVSNNVIPLTGLDHLADLHTKTRSVIAPTPLHVEHSSFTSFAELDARSNHSVNKPGLHNSTSIIPAPDPSPKQQYSPEYKPELKAFIADVLSRQQ
ncbi:hypothetical protein B0J17DRAFT_724365 [Rhizoctonia solani]|nr:hypothetical protein B0J17DRAFT_724365 [Rhizoctonia solani]